MVPHDGNGGSGVSCDWHPHKSSADGRHEHNGHRIPPSPSSSSDSKRVVTISSVRRDSLKNNMALVPEVPASREDHRQPMLIRGGDHFGIFDRAARLHDRGSASCRHRIEPIAEREERI